MAVNDSSSNSTDSAPRRRRATAPRKRTGCSTCKQRHVRCDEGRPTCANCIKANKTCMYKAPELPLRERRIQPAGKLLGQLDPWVVTTTGGQPTPHKSWAPAAGSLAKLVPGRRLAFDPFDVMACSMPFNSKKLLHYFHHANASLVNFPKEELPDSLLLASPDTNALRGTLLLATLHYVWNTGDTETFKPAMYHHKVESIATINSDLSKRGHADARRSLRLICTLAVCEACLGNVVAAQTHLAGLLAAVDELDRGSESHRDDSPHHDLDEELTERHFLSSVMFVYFLIRHIEDMANDAKDEQNQQSHHHSPGQPEGPQPCIPRTTCPICSSIDNHGSANLSLIHNGHKTEADGLKRRLETIRMLPYFFSPIPEHVQRLEPVDVAPTIAGLRQMMRDVELMRKEEFITGKRCNKGEWLWEKGSATNVWCAMNGAHAESLAKGRQRDGRGSRNDREGTSVNSAPPSYPSSSSPITVASPASSIASGASSYRSGSSSLLPRSIFVSWTAFNAAAAIYMCCVLNMVDMDPRFLRRAVIDISSEFYNPLPSNRFNCNVTEAAGVAGAEQGDDKECPTRQGNRDDEADVQFWITLMGFIAIESIAPHVPPPSKDGTCSGDQQSGFHYAWSRREFEDLQRNLRVRLHYLMGREASRNNGSLRSWTEARGKLLRTVWLGQDHKETQQQERRWEEIWDRATAVWNSSAHVASR